MATISTLAVNLIARTSVFEKNIRRSKKTAKDFETTLQKVGRTARKMGSILRTGFSRSLSIMVSGMKTVVRWAKITAAALVGIGIASVKIATDVQETENLFNISMGSMSKSANKWAKEYSKSLGLFTNDTKKSLGTFQLMLTSMGLTEKQAFKMSKQLTTLANDIASFRNQRPADIFLKLQAGITGESEPLKRLGILVNETVIKNLALEDSTIKARIATKDVTTAMSHQVDGAIRMTTAVRSQGLVLTDVEKIMLRYKAIVKATEKDQGDMKRTLDDTANVFRVIWSQIKVTANTIGTALLPVVTKASIVIRDWLINNQALFDKWASKAASAIEAVIAKLKEYFALAKAGKFEDIFRDIGRLFIELKQGLVRAFEKIKPFAVNIGEQIATGFLDSIEDTKFGRFLKGTGKVLDAVNKPLKFLGEDIGDHVDGLKRFLARTDEILIPGAQSEREGFDIQSRQLNKAIGSIRERASGAFNPDRTNPDILNELKRIRQIAEENRERF